MLTVIGKKLAKEGQEFVYIGPAGDCKGCKVRNICFHLERGSKYRVVEVRNVSHDCPVHEDGVSVVQVEEMPRDASLPAKLAIEGSTVSLERPRCIQRGCPSRDLCFAPGLELGIKKRVSKVGGKLDCAMGHSRVLVTLE